MKEGRVNSEGYINVADRMGLSGARGMKASLNHQCHGLVLTCTLPLQITQHIIRTGWPDNVADGGGESAALNN